MQYLMRSKDQIINEIVFYYCLGFLIINYSKYLFDIQLMHLVMMNTDLGKVVENLMVVL